MLNEQQEALQVPEQFNRPAAQQMRSAPTLSREQLPLEQSQSRTQAAALPLAVSHVKLQQSSLRHCGFDQQACPSLSRQAPALQVLPPPQPSAPSLTTQEALEQDWQAVQYALSS